MELTKKHLKLIVVLGAGLASAAIIQLYLFFILSPESAKHTTSENNSCVIVTDGNVKINYENEVDAKISKLRNANIAFNSPSTMKKNKVKTISLILSSKETMEKLLKEIAEKEKEAASIKYSNRMKAELIGENKKAFEIVKITPSIQAVGTIMPTRWKWDVTPLESGTQYLHLSLTAFITVDENETELSVKTFDRKIQVHVSKAEEIQDFFTENWKWFLGSLIFPLIVWYWKSRQAKGNSNNG